MTEDARDVDGQGFWNRLRRRKVAQWGIAYAAAAWGFLQVLDYLSDAFGWPSQIRQLAFLALLIGLPVALTIAWYHGDRGEQRVVRTELAIIALLFIAGGGILWVYSQRSGQIGDAAPLQPTPTQSADSEWRPSIAVLPFENRSALPEDAFFADGVHDDILMQLTRNGAMRVIARTSVEQFRGTRLTTREIGEKLGVNHVLEGGVQRAGDRVRVSIQLIDTSNDTQLWAEKYDRELTVTNLFAIQTEIGEAIANALRATLVPSAEGSGDSAPTQSLEAWESYQLGLQRMDQRTVGGLIDAERFFRRAVAQDPNFAPAYAGLADAVWLKSDYAGETMSPAMDLAQELVDHALALDPNLVQGITTSAKLMEMQGNFEMAESGYRRAIALNANYAPAHRWYAGLLAQLGRDEEALASIRSAVVIDPMSTSLRVSLGALLVGLGQIKEALTELHKANEIDPHLPAPYFQTGMLLAWNYGQVGTALPWFEKAVELDPLSEGKAVAVAELYFDLGDEANLQNWLGRASSLRSEAAPSNDIAMLRMIDHGDQEQALELAREAFRNEPIHPVSLWPLRLLRDNDLHNGQYERARTRYAVAFPELLSGDPQQLIDSNYHAAIDLCVVLLADGDEELAGLLLDRSEALIQRIQRMGWWGYRIEDARINALRGRRQLALDGLREATRAGWRGPFWRYYCDSDPALAPIRDSPEFKSLFVEIEQDMARQREELATRPQGEPLDISALR